MPQDFDLPFRVYDFTNDRELKITTEEQWVDSNIANVANATEGDIREFYFSETSSVNVQISTSGNTFQIKSSSASDTTQTVRVEGFIDSGLTVLGSETKTLNGTSVVSGTTTFYKITHFSKSDNTTGFITLENSSGTDLAILGAVSRVSRYKAFRFGLIPDDSSTIVRVFYKKQLTKLVNDGDYPFVECDDYLIYNASAIAMQRDKENIQRAQLMQALAGDALNAIMLSQSTKNGPDFQHKYDNPLIQAHRSG